MLKKITLTALGLLMTINARAMFSSQTYKDFADGACIGFAHGLTNKGIASACDLARNRGVNFDQGALYSIRAALFAVNPIMFACSDSATFCLASKVTDKCLSASKRPRPEEYKRFEQNSMLGKVNILDSFAAYGSSRTALNLGHGLAQGLVEGSSYDPATRQIRIGLAFNATQICAAYGFLCKAYNRFTQPK